MSEASKSFVASAEQNKVGPDYFGFYTREVTELLSQDDSSILFSQTSNSSERVCGEVRDMVMPEHCDKQANCFTSYDPLFSNGFGALVSDFKKEKLKALLRQSVVVLNQEVDEMLNPVVAMQHLQSQLRRKRRLSGAASDGGAEQLPLKKLKISSSLSDDVREVSGSKDTDSKLQDVALSGKAITSDVNKYSALCHTTETAQWRTGPQGPNSLCNSCGIKNENGTEPLSGLNQDAEKETGEVDNDLQYLLENDSVRVEETVKKYSDELFATLEHMEKQLEELLDAAVYKCRLMTLQEKQQLRKLIEELPPKNLDRVVEIIQNKKPSETKSRHEIYVDLEEADNVTLWRLYYYVEAVENARKLSLVEPQPLSVRDQ